MIKKIINRLFFPEKERNLNSRTERAVQKEPSNSNSNQTNTIAFKKGEIHTFTIPNLGNQEPFIVTEFYYKPGDVVKAGAILCEIENEEITIEMESYFYGKIIATCALEEELTTGTEILKIEVL
ncbi:biotin/lipoyl-containing protein [Flavobacterium sp.]|uniref:biotin/lipoyl-containing protein n=1 Tax=Flavobacterium sp. TaxID=239 RepID=UPI00404755AE